jgi:hypothetical protein
MYSSGELQFSDLLKCFLLGDAFDLLGADFPSESVLESEDAPCCPWLDMLGLQTQQYQISHERDGHGSFHPPGILSDLSMTQAHSALANVKVGQEADRRSAHRPR